MEAKVSLFQDKPQAEREELIRGMATKTEFSKVRRHYTNDERDQMKDHVVIEGTRVMEQTEEFKKIQKQFTDAVKVSKESITDALKSIKRGYSENEEEVFMLDDQDNGEMHIYDKNGIYLSSRPLYPEERQTTILQMPKTGTND